jgi:muconolactone delta-isomerase
MKYMLTWHEREHGSAIEYENAQKHILGVFRHWQPPKGFKIEGFFVRLGEWGGHMLVECDDVLAVHKLCSTFPAFRFEANPVLAIEDAVRIELEAIAWRDQLKT